ncbi:hypothetical protein MVEN_02501700 [Mycena venus]|uniref:Uncharacterized protein n=1 Tax=Mycena venus TaxID=2733690 RepID=A0A8H6U3X4_9AGAR|nr:hypothetical protein MVEN_02501700 [Mycena venus]
MVLPPDLGCTHTTWGNRRLRDDVQIFGRGSSCLPGRLETVFTELVHPLAAFYRSVRIGISTSHRSTNATFKVRGHLPFRRADAFSLVLHPPSSSLFLPWPIQIHNVAPTEYLLSSLAAPES